MNYIDLGAIQGSLMFGPEGDSVAQKLARRRIYEPRTTEAILRGLPRGGAMVDIGAHIGYFTLLAARAVGPEGEIMAFEPVPDNFKVLCENIRINQMETIRVAQVAAWDKNTMLKIKSDGPRSQIVEYEGLGGRSPRDVKDGGGCILAAGQRLDEFARHIMPDIIKTDTQGADLRALKGMPKMVERAKIIIAEYWPAGFRQFGDDLPGLTVFLTERGFSLYALIRGHPPLGNADLETVLSGGRHIEICAVKKGVKKPWPD